MDAVAMEIYTVEFLPTSLASESMKARSPVERETLRRDAGCASHPWPSPHVTAEPATKETC